MKKNRFRKCIAVTLATCTLATLLAGCAKETEQAVSIEPMEAEASHAFGFDIAGGDDVMPIAAYYGPYASNFSINGQSLPDYVTDEYWKAMADCGINLMSHAITDYAYSPQTIQKNLDLGEKYNIAVIVDDTSVRNMADLDEISMDKITTQLSQYMNHPAFGGLYLVDEPMTSYFLPADDLMRELYRYEDISPLLLEKIGIFCYENALSSSRGDKERENYEKYLREYCDVLKPKYLSFDRYPYDIEQQGFEQRYFFDLAKVRKVAQEYEIPFWGFFAGGNYWRYDTEKQDNYGPNEGQFDWCINSSLAFGAQGISYFPFIQPSHYAFGEDEEGVDWDFERSGFIGAWGNKNQWYYYAQNISKHIQAIDEVLMNSVNKGVIASGEETKERLKLATEAMLEGTSWRELKDVEGEAIVGCFNYQGQTALYVVNFYDVYAQHIDLTFQEECNFTIIQGAEGKKLSGEGITLDMAAGEGVLIVFGGEE